MMLKEAFQLAKVAVGCILPIICVVVFVVLGWYIVWSLFLSRFRFVRELLGSGQEVNPSVEELKLARSKQSRKLRKE